MRNKKSRKPLAAGFQPISPCTTVRRVIKFIRLLGDRETTRTKPPRTARHFARHVFRSSRHDVITRQVYTLCGNSRHENTFSRFSNLNNRGGGENRVFHFVRSVGARPPVRPRRNSHPLVHRPRRVTLTTRKSTRACPADPGKRLNARRVITAEGAYVVSGVRER